jgi:hypothetical protein
VLSGKAVNGTASGKYFVARSSVYANSFNQVRSLKAIVATNSTASPTSLN